MTTAATARAHDPGGAFQSNVTPTGGDLWRSGWVRAVAIAHIVALALLPIPFGNFGFFIGQQALIYGMLALSIVVLTGYTGQISLMTYSFVGIGAITTGVAMAVGGWPFWLAIVLAGLATVPVSTVVAMAAIRLQGIYLAIATLTFSSALGRTFFSSATVTNDLEGWQVARPTLGPIDFSDDVAFYVLCLLSVVALVWMLDGLKKSRTGRVMLAVRDNEIEAQALGINVHRTKLIAFVMSGIIAGVGGAYLAVLLTRVGPLQFESPNVETTSIALLTFVVIGGVDSAWGAMLAAISLALGGQFFRGEQGWAGFMEIYGASLLILFLLKQPGGLVKLTRAQFELIRRRPAFGILVTAWAIAVNVTLIYAFERFMA